jgi:hypothetical protein
LLWVRLLKSQTTREEKMQLTTVGMAMLERITPLSSEATPGPRDSRVL